MTPLTITAITSGILYTAATLAIALRQKRYIYRPGKKVETTPESIGLHYKEIALQTDDGITIQAWYIPADAPNAQHKTKTILYCHGNAGDLADRIDIIQKIHALGFHTLIFDYHGYGNSQGTPSEEATHLDALAAWKQLTQKQNIPADNIIIYGRSLGAAVATRLAATHTPHALILDGAFTSIPAMARKKFPLLPVILFTRHSYDNLSTIRQIKCPLLIAHGKTDKTCPYKHGRQIFHAAPEPKQFIDLTCGHEQTAFENSPEFCHAIQNI